MIEIFVAVVVVVVSVPAQDLGYHSQVGSVPAQDPGYHSQVGSVPAQDPGYHSQVGSVPAQDPGYHSQVGSVPAQDPGYHSQVGSVPAQDPGYHSQVGSVSAQDPGYHSQVGSVPAQDPGYHSQVGSVPAQDPGYHSQVGSVSAQDPGYHSQVGSVPAQDPGYHSQVGSVPAQDPGYHSQVGSVPAQDLGYHSQVGSVPAQDPGYHNQVGSVPAQDLGYHSQVGIPAAKQIYKDETTTTPDVQSEENLLDKVHTYFVGVVATVDQSLSVCGASMLRNTHAITAAHCWWDGWNQAAQFTLVFGSEYIFVGGLRMNTTDVEMHPQWDPMSLINDLAIITFEHVNYTDNIQSIFLPTTNYLRNKNHIGTFYQASGYGIAIADNTGFKPALRHTVLPLEVVPTDQCVNSQLNYNLMEKTLCTRSMGPVCIGHSGGPLSAEVYGQRYLIGVASFGDYTCSHNQYTFAGFVCVTRYLDWLGSALGFM